MKIEIISGGEYGVEQAALAAAWSRECPSKGFVRKGFITSQGPCEKLKFLGVQEIESDKLRDCAQRCIDECNGVILLHSGELGAIEENIKNLVGESRPCFEYDFLNPVDPRSITVWLLTEGVTKLYVTGKSDPSGLDIFYKKTLTLMNHVIKDINDEFARNELEAKKKAPTKKVG
jgi:hypothetical protein